MSLSHRLGRLSIRTAGPGFHDITSQITRWLSAERIGDGLLTLFLQHTSASLTIQENADPDVQVDLLAALDRLAPADAGWIHTTEGPDDMPAHVKTMLTGVNLAIPVEHGRTMLGTWQGIYLVEHRTRPHDRAISLHFIGTIDPG
jgi:secondary thiamine-phosphate synthase enzyme